MNITLDISKFRFFKRLRMCWLILTGDAIEITHTTMILPADVVQDIINRVNKTH